MKNVFLNYVSAKLCHEKTCQRAGKERTFVNVSIPYAQSLNGFATISVNVPQVLPATKMKDKSPIEGLKNVLLGAPEKERNMSYAASVNANGGYEFVTVKITNQALADMWKASRKANQTAKTEEPAVAEAEC